MNITEAAKQFLATAETWRTDELDVKRRTLADLEQQLGAAQEKTRTLPVTIGNLRATIARLEARTAADIAREALENAQSSVILHPLPPGEVIEAPLTQPQPEPYRPGLPPERLRKVWAEWNVTPTDDVVTFRDGEYNFASWGNGEGPLWWPLADTKNWSKYSLRPHGKTWSEVEAKADEADKPAEPKMLDLRTVRRAAEHADPDWVVADADLFDVGEGSPSIKKGQHFQVERIAADHRGLPRVKVTTREGGYNQHFIAAIQPAHVVTAEPKQPALLDLRELPPGTVCEASKFFPIYNSGCMIHAGDRFSVVGQADGDLPVLIKFGGKDWWLSALVPARVVREGAGQ